MAYHSFESLKVWQLASRLAVDVYRLLENCRDRSMKDQMTRAAVSVASNIAEGYERGTNREFVRFINIAKGSAAELRTQLYIAKEIGLIQADEMNRLTSRTKQIAAMLQNLATKRKSMVTEDDHLPTPTDLNQQTN